MEFELWLERLSLFEGYKGILPRTYSTLYIFYIKYLIRVEFILVYNILPKSIVHNMKS